MGGTGRIIKIIVRKDRDMNELTKEGEKFMEKIYICKCKRCDVCGKLKPLDQFGDGLRISKGCCMECAEKARRAAKDEKDRSK